MIACVDTHYSEAGSRTALLLFRNWTDSLAEVEYVKENREAAPEYIPGQFYMRELPCITAILERAESDVNTIVVDGYVQLGQGRDGLGKKLFDLLERRIPVVGVAKNPFAGANEAVKLSRRGSKRPLFITSIGIPVADAVQYIDLMHGQFRIPTLLKQVDRLSRGITT